MRPARPAPWPRGNPGSSRAASPRSAARPAFVAHLAVAKEVRRWRRRAGSCGASRPPERQRPGTRKAPTRSAAGRCYGCAPRPAALPAAGRAVPGEPDRSTPPRRAARPCGPLTSLDVVAAPLEHSSTSCPSSASAAISWSTTRFSPLGAAERYRLWTTTIFMMRSPQYRQRTRPPVAAALRPTALVMPMLSSLLSAPITMTEPRRAPESRTISPTAWMRTAVDLPAVTTATASVAQVARWSPPRAGSRLTSESTRSAPPQALASTASGWAAPCGEA